MPNALQKIRSDGKIFYQSCSSYAHPTAGTMVQQPIPLSFIRRQRYDVSVSDIVMTGPLAKIISSLHTISLRSQSIYTTDKHKTVKVWLNRLDKKTAKAPLYPMLESMLHNTSFLALKGVGVGLGQTVVDLLQGAGVNDASFCFGLESILGSEIRDSPLRDAILDVSVFELLTQPIDLLFKKACIKHLKSKHASPLKTEPQGKAAFLKLKSLVEKHIKPLIRPTQLDSGVDVNISRLLYNMPQGWKNTNLAPLMTRVKATSCLITADDYIIRVGSNFNKHHAGFVVDLDTNNIEIDELVYFLSYYQENKKLVNCFLNSGLNDL
ncbi:hypothetical protein ACN3E9_06785 [Vibrio pectenicida]|uniref:hypothetical protein n=1 Tax=Vibrio pectenicida TaxID=62763 RepID=UPI003B9904AF